MNETNVELPPNINEGNNARGNANKYCVEAIEMQTMGHHNTVPDEAHSPCSTAMPCIHTLPLLYSPMLMTLLFPPVSEADIKLGKELDLQQGDTLSYILEHAENEHWLVAEYSKGQDGYVPVSHMMIITRRFRKRDVTGPGKKYRGRVRMEPRLEGRRDRKEKEERSIQRLREGIKRNATTYVGDSTGRKTDSRLSKGEDVVLCLPGARIEHVTERVEAIMGRGKG